MYLRLNNNFKSIKISTYLNSKLFVKFNYNNGYPSIIKPNFTTTQFTRNITGKEIKELHKWEQGALSKKKNIMEQRKVQEINPEINQENVQEIKQHSTNINPSTAGQVVEKDLGLRKFLNRVYTWSGTSLLCTITGSSALSYLVSNNTNLMENTTLALGFIITGAIGMFVSCHFIQKIDYEVKDRLVSLMGVPKFNYWSEQPTSRKLAFAGLVASSTVLITPLTALCIYINPIIMPLSGLLTVGIMSGASLYALKQPNESLLTWKGPLYGALLTSIGIGLASIASHLILGPNVFSLMWFSVEPYLGIALFTALTSYDTHNAIKTYRNGDPDHIGCATEFYLNAVNLLIRIMEILAKIYAKK